MAVGITYSEHIIFVKQQTIVSEIIFSVGWKTISSQIRTAGNIKDRSSLKVHFCPWEKNSLKKKSANFQSTDTAGTFWWRNQADRLKSTSKINVRRVRTLAVVFLCRITPLKRYNGQESRPWWDENMHMCNRTSVFFSHTHTAIPRPWLKCSNPSVALHCSLTHLIMNESQNQNWQAAIETWLFVWKIKNAAAPPNMTYEWSLKPQLDDSSGWAVLSWTKPSATNAQNASKDFQIVTNENTWRMMRRDLHQIVKQQGRAMKSCELLWSGSKDIFFQWKSAKNKWLNC